MIVLKLSLIITIRLDKNWFGIRKQFKASFTASESIILSTRLLKKGFWRYLRFYFKIRCSSFFLSQFAGVKTRKCMTFSDVNPFKRGAFQDKLCNSFRDSWCHISLQYRFKLIYIIVGGNNTIKNSFQKRELMF